MTGSTVMILLWIYSATAWNSYAGTLSEGWYVYDQYYTDAQCRDMMEAIKPHLVPDSRITCLPNRLSLWPEPLAKIIEGEEI